ncbi:ATP-binding protein [Geomesophilobacter sediminis]|uniref:histidine kinase n=1 Tax=Geomesophilobacter sediminis TaxID=2798584 RepID=A0A8J7JG51_9BACT|nr:ATP-binding protein [Geomesophilobacter sediminis]MBJ6723390.1 GAF domain-containing protein [Geomesophilobacter sediminis]
MGDDRLRETPLYNSRIIDAYLKLVRQKYPQLDLAALLEHAGMKGYEVADQAHWFGQEQVERFYEKLVQMTGNPNIAREAGRYAASPDALGAMRQYILALVGAAHTFELISRITANFTRSSVYRSRRLARNKVEIVVTPLQPGLEKPFQCENRIGFFEAVVLAFSNAPPRIEHPECMFSGGATCRYLISWEPKPSESLRRTLRTAVPLLFLADLAAGVWGGISTLAITLPGTLIVILVLELVARGIGEKELLATLNNTRESNESLIEQINVNYNNALLAHEIGRALGSYRTREQMLEDVAGVLRRRLDYDRGVVLLADPLRCHLELATSYGFADCELECLKSAPFSLDEPLDDPYLRCFQEQRPLLVDASVGLEATLASRSFACSTEPGTRSFICCPLVSEGESLGVIAVEQLHRHRPLVESDLSLIMGTASMIAISLRNLELFEDLQRAKEELELRVAKRTEDLEKSRRSLEDKNAELERANREIEEESAGRVRALEELREKERMLIQQSRLAALGEMINNIAHQWRQPLNELALIVQELPMMFDQNRFSREYLKESVAKFMRVVGHLSKTIDDFRNFFRPDQARVPFRLRDVVERTLSLVVENFRQQGVAIEVALTGDPVLEGYPNEFSQALLNILLNARDAFVDREIAAPRRIQIAGVEEGGHCVVTISDNAGGIDPAILDRIFDPYFTTRGPEQGTGIGLYLAKMIIEKNLRGRLSAANVAEGAQFRIEV